MYTMFTMLRTLSDADSSIEAGVKALWSSQENLLRDPLGANLVLSNNWNTFM